MTTDPVGALNQLGATWSPDFDAYATGKLDASRLGCVLCELCPCDCPPFGSPEYMALVRKLHPRRGASW